MVKIIVDAEKQAAKIIEDAKAEAVAIRKRIDGVIQEQREKTLAETRKEAAYIAARGKQEAKAETEKFEKESAQALEELVTKASAKKNATVDKLVGIVLQVEK